MFLWYITVVYVCPKASFLQFFVPSIGHEDVSFSALGHVWFRVYQIRKLFLNFLEVGAGLEQFCRAGLIF